MVIIDADEAPSDDESPPAAWNAIKSLRCLEVVASEFGRWRRQISLGLASGWLAHSLARKVSPKVVAAANQLGLADETATRHWRDQLCGGRVIMAARKSLLRMVSDVSRSAPTCENVLS
jgi:hypothetical protein